MKSHFNKIKFRNSVAQLFNYAPNTQTYECSHTPQNKLPVYASL